MLSVPEHTSDRVWNKQGVTMHRGAGCYTSTWRPAQNQPWNFAFQPWWLPKAADSTINNSKMSLQRSPQMLQIGCRLLQEKENRGKRPFSSALDVWKKYFGFVPQMLTAILSGRVNVSGGNKATCHCIPGRRKNKDKRWNGSIHLKEKSQRQSNDTKGGY